ncbi:MAG TPA: restriction endonuclease subunit S, partial [Ignavibacteriaceae bacterium]|nr:restriction endonuclease subunit S [Ignavibacteriaceae bacterium]
MSKTSSSSVRAKNKLVPKLRFPEFKNENEWEEKVVSEVAEYENGKSHEQDIQDNGSFVVVNSKFISSEGEVRKFTNKGYCIAKKEDVLMVLSDVPNGKAIAKCFFVDKDNFYTVNQRVCKITPTDTNSKILFYLVNRNPYFLAFDDGVKQTNLRKEDVENCQIVLPKNPKEQQKIAECLSSLDDLITAENQKLESLKAHKKGLMQNLFPAEGENVPKLRFKEFENSGEWEEKSLGLACKMQAGKFV